MDLPIRLCVVIATIMMRNSECMPHVYDNDDKFTNIRCTDTNDAMDYLHSSLPDQMPLEQRCKRYAVIASYLTSKGPPQHWAMCRVGSSDEEIEQLYRRFDAHELATLYMTVIDGYRAASYLGPAFLELIECLKRIDRPYVETYINNPELTLIVDLHKQVVQSRDTMIDLDSIDLRNFSTAFRISLENIFKANLIGDTLITQNQVDNKDPGASGPNKLEIGEQKVPRFRRRLISTHRHREQERLRRYRLRILQPHMQQVANSEGRRRYRKQRRFDHAQRQLTIWGRLEQAYRSYPAPAGESCPEQQSAGSSHQGSEIAPAVRSIEMPFIPGIHMIEYRPKNHDDSSQSIMTESVRDTHHPSICNQPSPSQLIHPPQRVSPGPRSLGSITGMPDPFLSGQTPSRPQPEPPINRITSSPHLSQVNPGESVTDLSRCDLAPGNTGPTYNYPIENDTEKVEELFELPVLPRVDQFDDIESVMESFSEIPKTREDSGHDFHKGT